MAKKMMYSFEEKKNPTDGIVSTIMGSISLILLIAAVYSSYYMRGKAGIYAGAFIIGVKSFARRNIKYKYPKIGSILCGIVFVIWLGVTFGGA